MTGFYCNEGTQGNAQRDAQVRYSEAGVEKKKVTIITNETHEVLVFRQLPVPSTRAWCAGCGLEAEMISPEQSSLLADVSVRTVYRWAEAGAVHFLETHDGLLLICRHSLLEGLAFFPKQLATGNK